MFEKNTFILLKNILVQINDKLRSKNKPLGDVMI
jgi:hypothetical protein